MGDRDAIPLTNPLRAEEAWLRTRVLPGLLHTVARNQRWGDGLGLDLRGGDGLPGGRPRRGAATVGSRPVRRGGRRLDRRRSRVRCPGCSRDRSRRCSRISASRANDRRPGKSDVDARRAARRAVPSGSVGSRPPRRQSRRHRRGAASAQGVVARHRRARCGRRDRARAAPGGGLQRRSGSPRSHGSRLSVATSPSCSTTTCRPGPSRPR